VNKLKSVVRLQINNNKTVERKTTENLAGFPGNDCQAGDTFTLFRFLTVCAN
jgi:hypothetical protein